MTKLATVGSKKAVEPQTVNDEILSSVTKRANFDQVAAGICPHDNAKLGDEIRGSGIGITRICETCGHIWYLNRKIRTCKCLTCSGVKRNSKEHKISNRIENQSAKNSGGPPCTIRRTFELAFALTI